MLEAVGAVRFRSATEFAWFGQSSGELPDAVRSAMDPATERAHVVQVLTDRLYRDFYCRGGAAPGGRRVHWPARGLTAFVDELVRANAGRGPWEDGWVVQAIDGAVTVVERDGLTLRAPLWRCRAEPPGSLQPGAQGRLRLPPDLVSIFPGFYMALGDVDVADHDDTVVRLYWNVDDAGAAELVAVVTAHLNRAGLPFRLKVANDPALYARRDSAVLYLPRSAFTAAVSALSSSLERLGNHLRAGVPALTKQIAPGLGVAEDPGQAGSSFGQHRCRLIAEGLVDAHEAGRSDVAARAEAVTARFARDGIDLDRPYLNSGSAHDYAL